MEETGIMLLPSEILEYGSGYVRIGFGRANMVEGLEQWGRAIRGSKVNNPGLGWLKTL